MTIRVAVQMDPPESIDPNADTSFAMIETAQDIGHAVWVYGPEAIWRDEERVRVTARPCRIHAESPRIRMGPAVGLDLGTDIDVVLMRQNPPMDDSYFTAAYLLALLAPETLVVNDPAGVMTSPEKILPLAFPDLIPPTLISRDPVRIAAFRAEHGEIVIKPLHGHGGRGIFFIRRDEVNFDTIVEMFRDSSTNPVIAQAFLSEVRQGDKRILLVDGEPVGAINRRPETGSIRANLIVGGQAEADSLTATDRDICARIGPELRRRGLLFVGIDVIGGKLTEINVTSPTGVQALKRLCGLDAVSRMWEHIAQRLSG